MLARLSARLAYCCEVFAAIGSAVLAILVSYVVFQRMALHDTPYWAEELPRLVLVWTAFVGGVACTHRQTHLSAGLLAALVHSPRARTAIRQVGGVVMIIGLLILGYAGWQLAQMTMGQLLPALGVPAGWVYMALPVASVAMALVQLDLVLHPRDPIEWNS
jgi:TRAP-type C4-dicarboxylate transport system permease small subunit